MNIGIITDSFLPVIGGAEIHVNKLAQFLQSAGHSVEIFTLTPGLNQVNRIPVIRHPRPQNYLKYRTVYFIPFLLKSFFNLYAFAKNKQVLHSHYTSYLTALSVVVAKMRMVPVVVTLHGAGTLDSSAHRSLLGTWYRFLSFKLADKIISTSQEMAEIALRYVDQNKVVIIPNGVDTQEFLPEIKKEDPNKFVVMTTRRLVPKNGVQYLIESIPKIVQEVNNLEFIIIGTGSLEAYLKQRVAELGIERYIQFVGKIENQAIKNYLTMADIVVFPSSAESTSISCLEAMAMGKAVVASSVGAYPDILGNNERGILVYLFDTNESNYSAPLSLNTEKTNRLVEAIVRLCKNKSLKDELGKKAREYVVKNYDWRNLIPKIIEIYNKLVALKGKA